jgi:hypothetical protein
MSETSKKIIEEIHERHVTHRPKWQFLIRNITVWVVFAAAVALGALSASVEEAFIEKGIGSVPGVLSSQFVTFVCQWMSLLWIGCAILFVVLAFLNLRISGEGYRYRTAWVVLGIILMVAAIVMLLRHEGVGERAESMLGPFAPHEQNAPRDFPGMPPVQDIR